MSESKANVKTFLMMGMPGSGKGTQAMMLADKVNGVVYSSGSRLRQMASSGSYFGKRARAVMDSGDLMPVWVSQYLFEEALIRLEPEEAVVFEGSCRILEEAQRFHEAALWLGRPYIAIHLEAHPDELKIRLHNRRVEGRGDDSAEVLQERFDKFNELTSQSIEYFRGMDTLITINGSQSVEDVHRDIVKALGLN